MDFIIVGIGILVCLLIGFALSSRRKYKTLEPIRRYEEKRDTITKEQAGVEEEESDEDDDDEDDEDDGEDEESGSSISGIIGLFISVTISIFILVNVVMPVLTNIQNMSNSSDYGSSPYASTITTALVPLIGIGIVISIVSMFTGFLDTSEPEKKKKKDTRHRAIKHYSNTRDAITMAQLKKGKKK